MVPFAVGLLGSFKLTKDGVDVRPRSRKARGLLAFLAASPDCSVSRERAADLLWSDRGAEQARGSLRQTLAELRSLDFDTEEIVRISRETISLAPDQLRCDVDLIHAAALDRDGAGLARALEGADMFLADLVGLSPAFDEWLFAERARQSERLVDAVLAALPPIMATSPAPVAQSILRSLDRLDPWNEAVARLGMEADAAAGDVASLHKRYRRFVAGLRQEYDVSPSDETRLLFDRLTAVPRSEPAGTGTTAETAPPMVLVAPIEAIGSGAETAELAAITTDDIRTALKQHDDIRVIMLHPGDVERVERVCRDSIAAYMLSGRLRRLGADTRFNLQMDSIASHAVVWSKQIKVDTAELGSAVDAVVEQAVGAVLPAIDHDLSTRVPLASFARNDSVTLYVKARRLVGRGHDLAETREGVRLLEQLVERDPRHVGGLMLLSRMYNNDLWQRIAGHDVAAYRARAQSLTEQAAELMPSSGQIQIRLAWCHLRQRSWSRAERNVVQAVERLPYDSDALNQCAFLFTLLGDFGAAEPILQRAFRLNPFPPGDYHADHAIMLMLRGDNREAEEHFDVSRDQSLLYLFARLLNMVRLPDMAAERAQLAAAFNSSFRRAWQLNRPATLADLRVWIEELFPLRLPEHAARMTDDLERALEPGWRVTPGNAS